MVGEVTSRCLQCSEGRSRFWVKGVALCNRVIVHVSHTTGHAEGRSRPRYINDNL
ncbi:MAG: hypothetical protein HC838_01195 [Spirulinaceae cyanobacterium RM2_2_10]|nr:hypothetical protein [Spirulinaceae cyanobacterium RM2_2_10]